MERNLRVTRIYALKPYENLTLNNEIVNIPEELIADHEIISGLTKLQLLEMELQFNYYCALRQKTNKAGSIEDIQVLLEEERATEIEALFDNKNFNEYLNKLVKGE